MWVLQGSEGTVIKIYYFTSDMSFSFNITFNNTFFSFSFAVFLWAGNNKKNPENLVTLLSYFSLS